MEKFVVNKNQKGEFKYDFIDKNGLSILSKLGYKNKSLCIKAIESIKRNSLDDSRFFRKRTAEDECYFNLKSPNGQILGKSKLFEDKAARENGIEYLKIKIKNAIIEDNTLKQKNAILEKNT